MRVYPLGPTRTGGGTYWLLEGAAPNAGVEWSISGGGTLTPLGSSTNGAGAAMAKWDAAGATVGATLTVSVNVYA